MAAVDGYQQRGLLIVIEGLDRSGKSTQCQKLLDTLQAQGREVRYVKFPGRPEAFHTHFRMLILSQTELRLLVR
jgi:thymidylate kinase